jgi:mannitol/fructose-specific phosphotransferase system IIA component (Ntr-type)
MLLSDIFKQELIKVNLESKTKHEAFEELVETIIAAYPKFNRQELIDAILTRENQMSTAIMPGVAVPHGYCAAVNGIIGALGFSRTGIDYDCHEPVHSIVMLLMDNASPERHLRVLSRLLDLLNSSAFAAIQPVKGPREVYDLLSRF